MIRETARPSVEEALRLLHATCRALGEERLTPREALGRVLSRPLVAHREYPRFDMSAMDGFAVRSSDTLGATSQAPIALPLAAALPAGNAPTSPAVGGAVPISTGAPIPPGADAVLTRERGRISNERLYVDAPVPLGTNLRRAGEDATPGREFLPAGSLLAPDGIAACAAYGVNSVMVLRMPNLGLFATGNEIADPAVALAPFQHPDINSPMITACCAALGLPLTCLGRAPDTAEEQERTLKEALASPCDILLSTGGVSRGDFDMVPPALDRIGARILFHGVAMRPGKPMLAAVLPDGRLYFGLPGNPVAALLGFRFFVLTAVRAMLGLPIEPGTAAETDAPVRSGTTVFLRGRLVEERFVAAEEQRSHVLRSVLESNTWARLEQEPGSSARCLVYPKFPIGIP